MKIRRIQFVGFITRYDIFITNKLEGKALGKERIGRPRYKFLKDTLRRMEYGNYSK